MKRILIISALVLALVATTVFFASCGKNEKPQTNLDILADAIEKTQGDSELFTILKSALQGGSIESSFKFSGDAKEKTNIKSLTEKSYFGKDKLVEELAFTTATGKKANLTLFADNEKLIAACSALDYAYSLTSEGIEDLLSMLMPDNSDSSLASSSVPAPSDEMIAIIEKSCENIKAVMEEHIELKLTKEDDGTLVFTLDLNNKDVANLLEDLIVVISEDDELIDVIVDYMNELNVEDVPTRKQLKNDIEDLEELADKLRDTKASLEVEITCSKNRTIQTIYAEVDAPDYIDQPITLEVLFTTDGGFSLEVEVMGQTYTVAHIVQKSGSKRTEKLSIGAMGVSVTPITFVFNEKSGEYTLTCAIPATLDVTISGTYTADKETVTITVDEVSVTRLSGEAFLPSQDTHEFPITATFVINAKDEMPKAPKKTTNIADLDEDEIEDIIKDLQDDKAISSVIEKLKDLYFDNPFQDEKPSDDVV